MQVLTALAEHQRWTAAMHLAIAGSEPMPAEARLAMAALGICGELSELRQHDADVLVEAGDVMSYALLAAALLGIRVDAWIPEGHIDRPDACASIFPPSSIHPLDVAVDDALALAELIKKYVFQGKDLQEDEVTSHLQSIVQRVAAFLGASGYSMRQVLVANVIKLESRYPRAASDVGNKGEDHGGGFQRP